jgi:hypothetical protein
MTGVYACSTFFHDVAPEELRRVYEADAEPANGYLVDLHEGWWGLVDAMASETVDWGRQLELASLLTGDDGTAVSVFLVGEHWAMAFTHGGARGPVAVYMPEDRKVLERLPHELLALEGVLAEYFPDDVDADAVDALFGAVLEGATPIEDVFTEICDMLRIAPDWLRWSWYETIPEQLFTDPDLAPRVLPLGAVKELWEE